MQHIITMSLITLLLMGHGTTQIKSSIPILDPIRPVPIIEERIAHVEIESTDILIEEKETEIEFPDAKYVWNYLHDLGYNDAVAAGIIGNIMVECGGYTLDLQVDTENKSYYGICQWSKQYYPNVIGCSLESQCDFLRDTIQNEINTFGYNYDYNSFLEITDEREAALVFAKSYERCWKGTYELRQDCAEDALKYFLSLSEPSSADP